MLLKTADLEALEGLNLPTGTDENTLVSSITVQEGKTIVGVYECPKKGIWKRKLLNLSDEDSSSILHFGEFHSKEVHD